MPKNKVLLVFASLSLVIGGYPAPASAEPPADLISAAQKEGQLTIIALPRHWCRYGDLIDAFTAKYGLAVNELNPEGSSGDAIEAIKANRGNAGPQAPDVIDVGPSFGSSAKAEGLIQPYKVADWSSIPDWAKDADGFWYGSYYGVLAFEVNTDLVKTLPKDWSDLLKPEFANSVALGGSPRTAYQAIMGVYAAGLSFTNGNAAKAPEAGLKFFRDLNYKGNFVPVEARPATVAQGTTPISIRWDYNALSNRDTLNGNPPIEVVVPASGVVAGMYVLAISAFAPHPNAAKLWMEHLLSDEGQLAWLKGYCHPIRFAHLVKANKVPEDLLKKLPPAGAYETAVFPTLAEQDAAKAEIAGKWDSVVNVTVK
jgi:putative spermidine/putrescine transport system substrate-binding protein